MAGWYIRRGEKILGPLSSGQIKEAFAAGKVLATDQVAKDPAGPWTEIGKTSIAKREESPPKPQVPAVIQQPKPSVPVVIEAQPSLPSAPKGFKSTVIATWTSITRTIAVRAQRKHELKLAKLQALAAQQSSAKGSPPNVAGPAAVQTVVNVTNVNKNINKGGCVLAAADAER